MQRDHTEIKDGISDLEVVAGIHVGSRGDISNSEYVVGHESYAPKYKLWYDYE